MMNLYETKLKESQVRKENEKMLMHLSNLYVESVHLKKNVTKCRINYTRSVSIISKFTSKQSFEW